MPLVSIILPNYDYARFLRERFRTIIGQTFDDFELIYVDDGSTDQSNMIAAEHGRDPRLSMHLHRENSGRVYRRWNEGAALATGEWLWFAGADDVSHPRFLERLVDLVSARQAVSIVHSGHELMDAGGCLVESSSLQPGVEACVRSGAHEILKLSRNNTIRSASFSLLRRNVFEACGGFDERLWLCADWDLYIAMLKDHEVAYTPEVLGCFRRHPTNVSYSTRRGVHALENTYCLARAAQHILASSQFSKRDRVGATRTVRRLIMEVFRDPGWMIPPELAFAAETIHSVIPDARLRDRVGS